MRSPYRERRTLHPAWSILEKKCGDPLTHLNEMTFEANGNLLDTETEHGNDIEASELTTFKAPLTSGDDAWSILEEAFGDPSTHFNLRLRIMKATLPLSDKTVETDPNKAAIWLLQYEKAGRKGFITRTAVL